MNEQPDSGAIYRVTYGSTPSAPTLISDGAVHAGAELGRSLAADIAEVSSVDQKLVVAGAPGYETSEGVPGAAVVFDLTSSSTQTTRSPERT